MEPLQGLIRPAAPLQKAAAETRGKGVNLSSRRRRSAAQPSAPRAHHHATVSQLLAAPRDFCYHLPLCEAGRDDQNEGQSGL